LRRQASGATFALCARAQRKAPRRGGASFEVAVPTLTSPEAAPYSTAHVSGAMTRLSQAPVFVLTTPYASAPRKARFRSIALYGSMRLGSSSSRVECSRAGTCRRRVRISAETNNGHRRILAEVSRPSEFRFPETETVSAETRFDWKVTTRPVQGSGADETIRPFDVRPARNPFRLNRDFAPSICSVA
jgi:hypothetical protein